MKDDDDSDDGDARGCWVVIDVVNRLGIRFGGGDEDDDDGDAEGCCGDDRCGE